MTLKELTAIDPEVRLKWEQKGWSFPQYDIQKVKETTKENPCWVHFGAGNIFRVLPAAALQRILDRGLFDRGVIVAEGFDYEIITKAYRPFNQASVMVVLKSDGSIQKQVIGSVTESLLADTSQADWQRLEAVFAHPGLQLASFTITEKGYSIETADTTPLAMVDTEMAGGPNQARSMMGKITALCHHRYKSGAHPLALVSMDNCSHNGDILKKSVVRIARVWEEAGLASPGFCDWLLDPAKVSFPWSMIDKITPRPDPSVKQMLEADGFTDTEIIVTEKQSWTAPWVNAEEAEYLIIEDSFPNGRPPLEAGGIIFCEQETVDKMERMKVCTCLNPLHTALAIFGCLLSHSLISEEMKDPDLRALVERLGYKEGLPVATDPGIIKPQDFLKEVLEERLPNPFLPDTPRRIACDTSQKLAIRFGQTLLAYSQQAALQADRIPAITLVLAGWFRYLVGIDDSGRAFELSPDPLLDDLRARMGHISLGDKGPFDSIILPILADTSIFGLDLSKEQIARAIIDSFTEMLAEKGAVHRAIKRLVDSNSKFA